ncbi:MAG TPA: ECF transporter S component [Clostridia bacterium]|nr:ECF transporter S component [Clostridia bacterium]
MSTSMSVIKRLIVASLFLALCVVLPLLLHSIPNSGSILLPMHIPVLLCGLICGWPFGLACGALAPVLSSLITGMPPMAYLPSMLFELAAYGLVSGLMMKFIRTGKTLWDVVISLVTAMFAGRVVFGALNALIFSAGEYSFAVWLGGAFVTALPGIAIQIVLIPILVFALERAKLIPRRYTDKAQARG